jgi:hypothetical protein
VEIVIVLVLFLGLVASWVVLPGSAVEKPAIHTTTVPGVGKAGVTA